MTRNVEALDRIIREIWPTDDLTNSLIDRLASFLAVRGVLAVDALTDEQAAETQFDPTDTAPYCWLSTEIQRQAHGEHVRSALRRCATGEAE